MHLQLRPHRRDEFIEFIKSLILPTFILREANIATKRDVYADIFAAYVLFHFVGAIGLFYFYIHCPCSCITVQMMYTIHCYG